MRGSPRATAATLSENLRPKCKRVCCPKVTAESLERWHRLHINRERFDVGPWRPAMHDLNFQSRQTRRRPGRWIPVLKATAAGSQGAWKRARNCGTDRRVVSCHSIADGGSDVLGNRLSLARRAEEGGRKQSQARAAF